ncbi:monothiol glutaredoxin-S1-like [Senna tora]|uniref:Monothiol glutaredoxin-S1-like n=1 Tax=Senna tora TaxID=362788 RepID=A0A834TBW3_9FABA|nr:monothiol glutaredoxin-S1-like [Senna tora]
MEMVTNLVGEKPVVIFSKSSCCMSHTVKTLILSFGANPRMIEIDKLENGEEIESALVGLGCKPSVPAVFIGQKLIGGANEVISLNLQNKLPQLLLAAKAIFI